MDLYEYKELYDLLLALFHSLDLK